VKGAKSPGLWRFQGRRKINRLDELVRERKGAGDGPVTIKKYANRRLYNTSTSSYVTLEHLADMVRAGTDFVVQDAKSGEDITRSVLTQIIFEEENKGGQNLLPIRFLRQLINFYGHSLQVFLPPYLEASLETFAKNQEAFRERMAEAFGAPGRITLNSFEELTRNNLAMFERAMRMFSPLGLAREEAERNAANGGAPPKHSKSESDEIADLKSQLEAMRRQIEDLATRK
jgi:polyhydroxyalkanoate synthesis repressor PhaR